jgi:hypothetical protein
MEKINSGQPSKEISEKKEEITEQPNSESIFQEVKGPDGKLIRVELVAGNCSFFHKGERKFCRGKVVDNS